MANDKQLLKGIGVGCAILVIIVLVFAAMVAILGIEPDLKNQPSDEPQAVQQY